MSDPRTTPHDAQTAAASSSAAAELRGMLQSARRARVRDVAVEGLDGVWARYRAVGIDENRELGERLGSDAPAERVWTATLVEANVALWVEDDRGVLRSLNPEDRDATWVEDLGDGKETVHGTPLTFRSPRLHELLDVDTPSEAVRELYSVAEGGILTAYNIVSELSGFGSGDRPEARLRGRRR